ncbi:hypothetical protein ACLETS_23170 [Enterobacter ludwigii]|uniref:MrpH family fimbial adhesin n=1 Tax=Enterobacter ludwigii TaxID=299767 RepID=UPI003976DED4
MKRLINIFILIIVGLMQSHTSSASIWSWIDSIRQNSVTNFTYFFTIAEWEDTDSTPNPCYGLSACTIFISHRHDTSGSSGTGVVRSWGSGQNSYLLTSKTLGELGKGITSGFSLPYSSSTDHNGTVNYEECVAFFYASGRDLGTYVNGANSNSFSGYPILPGSICGVAPAPSGTCDFTQNTVTLDHGTLSRREIEGHTVTEPVNITCTSSENLKLYIYSGDKLPLRDDGSLYSELYLNDTVLGSDGLNVTVDNNATVNIKSVLKTNGTVSAGDFTGSTVMLISIE